MITATALSVEAKSKKKKAVASAKGKSSQSVRSSSARRAVARRSKRGRRVVREANYQPNPSPAIVPDRIEVMEFGSTNSSDLSRLTSPPQSNSNNLTTDVGTITPSRRVSIDAMRVIQIQQALASKGFYSGETSGNYDDATIDAMRRFQSSNKITATGYPTAHALKRLGLASW
ncbi:MAG: peptidoglycan-binding domain-containing protein [Blastocatellia bacterium]